MPTIANLEALSSVRTKINNLINYFLEPGHRAKNVALLLASTTFTYSAGSLKSVAAGDIIENINIASGAPMFWGCSVAGTPGTWIAGPNWP